MAARGRGGVRDRQDPERAIRERAGVDARRRFPGSSASGYKRFGARREHNPQGFWVRCEQNKRVERCGRCERRREKENE
eukprot:1052378-Pyramimonas_sp.AAC.1